MSRVFRGPYLRSSAWRRYLIVLKRDPFAVLHYVIGGKEALLRRSLTRLLASNPAEIREEFALGPGPLRDVFGEIAQLPYLGWLRAAEVLYVAVRALRPSVVLETGVAAGVSTASILAALERNGMGELHSIDLPNYEKAYLPPLDKEPAAILPEGRTTGFLVPEALRYRWHLHLGNTRQVLPNLLSNLHRIDLFLHDSEHTYDTMSFEYEIVWPHLQPGGLLLSDDVTWNGAFPDFCKLHGVKPVYFWMPGLGAVAKPRVSSDASEN